MITEIYAYEEAPSSYHASLFLVGPTPRGNEVSSWRPQALQILTKVYLDKNIHLVVFIPESRTGDYRYQAQVEWEQRHLELADVLLTWLPRDMSTSLKGLTTNLEFGKYVETGKLFYGRPEHADHIRYLDWMYQTVTGRLPANTLADLTQAIANYLDSQLSTPRQAGERFIPLHIWRTSQFQNWYRSQRQVGNHLVKAQLLWTFTSKVNYLFAYALHVHVWIAAEQRIKSNEFILSRPDISVVVPYWKHPSHWLDSEIVLIKEFRAPARTKDGFVHELPGGSHIKEGDKLRLASDELYEETSIKINSQRFRYVDSKQLTATWSTHYADVYAIELTANEIAQFKALANCGKTYGVPEDTEKTYIEVYQLKEIAQWVDWSMMGIIYQTLLSS